MNILVTVINVVAEFLMILVLASVILSYFMSPYHPVRHAIDSIVEPLLMPIRRVVPLVGMFDFSPLILILLIQFISILLTNLLISLR